MGHTVLSTNLPNEVKRTPSCPLLWYPIRPSELSLQMASRGTLIAWYLGREYTEPTKLPNNGYPKRAKETKQITKLTSVFEGAAKGISNGGPEMLRWSAWKAILAIFVKNGNQAARVMSSPNRESAVDPHLLVKYWKPMKIEVRPNAVTVRLVRRFKMGGKTPSSPSQSTSSPAAFARSRMAVMKGMVPYTRIRPATWLMSSTKFARGAPVSRVSP